MFSLIYFFLSSLGGMWVPRGNSEALLKTVVSLLVWSLNTSVGWGLLLVTIRNIHLRFQVNEK